MPIMISRKDAIQIELVLLAVNVANAGPTSARPAAMSRYRAGRYRIFQCSRLAIAPFPSPLRFRYSDRERVGPDA